MSEEYKKFLNWCEDKWAYEYKMKKILSKLSNDDINFLQNQYEASLKADMVVILEELDSEIRKLHVRYEDQLDAGLNIGVTRCSNLVQQKIDKLREGEL